VASLFNKDEEGLMEAKVLAVADVLDACIRLFREKDFDFKP